MTARHFLSLRDLSASELRRIIERAVQLKRRQRDGALYEPLKNRVLGMLFEKSSTRTRVSFEAAMVQMGGAAIYLSSAETQIGRGEPIEDVARVLSRMVDGVVFRTFEHERLERFAAESQVPVINALTDRNHPCQLLADIQTYVECRGDLAGRKVAWVGDGNNVCHSYIVAAERFNFALHVACPEGYEPDASILEQGGEWLHLTSDPNSAVSGADLVVTDVWTSMGQEREERERRQRFAPYQVNAALMARAKPDAIFMHCLPAHRGEEVTSSVIDGPQSVVWDEAENRLHAQKALLEFLLC